MGEVTRNRHRGVRGAGVLLSFGGAALLITYAVVRHRFSPAGGTVVILLGVLAISAGVVMSVMGMRGKERRARVLTLIGVLVAVIVLALVGLVIAVAGGAIDF